MKFVVVSATQPVNVKGLAVILMVSFDPATAFRGRWLLAGSAFDIAP